MNSIKLIYLIMILGLPVSLKAAVLTDLIQESLKFHPSVKSQQSLLDASGAAEETAQWQYYPTPSIALEKAATSGDDPGYQGDDLVVRVGLQQPLWTGGRLSAGLEKARASSQLSQALLEGQKTTISLALIRAYGDWYQAWHKQDVLLRAQTEYQAMKLRIQRRLKQGASSKSDLALVQARIAANKAEQASAEAQKRVALVEISQWVGRNISADELLQDKTLARKVMEHDPEMLSRQAIKHSPVLRQAVSDMAVASAEVDVRKAALKPNVYLRFEHQHGDFARVDADSENRIFLGVESRFGAGLSSLTQINEARAQLIAALERVNEQKRLVSEQTIAEYFRAISFAARIDALKVSVETAEKVSRSYQRQFLAGRKSWQENMNAVRDRVNAELQLVDTESAYLVSTWQLAVNTQGIDALLTEVL